ncbi:hypothetical protein CH64_1 [Yersinia rohdei]|uniref:Uncharacterized protein n=1 Tax=Yersinia rohdei TaxID=29485 RepID=A0ABN4EZE2_YERRO|nr:hypothetical protein CH64_1 [Yersinia rohdei]
MDSIIFNVLSSRFVSELPTIMVLIIINIIEIKVTKLIVFFIKLLLLKCSLCKLSTNFIVSEFIL